MSIFIYHKIFKPILIIQYIITTFFKKIQLNKNIILNLIVDKKNTEK